jgi:hypothetical protein
MNQYKTIHFIHPKGEGKKTKQRIRSGHRIIVVQLIIVLQHLSLDLGWIYPRNEVFHIPRYKECWVGNCLWTHSYMSLLYVCDSFFQVFTKLQPHQNSWEPASARRTNSQNKCPLSIPMKEEALHRHEKQFFFFFFFLRFAIYSLWCIKYAAFCSFERVVLLEHCKKERFICEGFALPTEGWHGYAFTNF